MKIQNMSLILTRTELYDLIKNDNTDTSDWSRDTLLRIITRYDNFSVKQYEWINSKVKYIINHNDKYKNFRKKFKSFELSDECFEDGTV
jgi:hypothetical protein